MKFHSVALLALARGRSDRGGRERDETELRGRKMKRYLGSHTSDSGGIDMAAARAGRAGMTALQIFTAPPRFYGDRSGIRPERVARFRAALEEAGIAPEKVVVHGAYVLGVATPEEEKWARASAGLAKELERSTALGVGAVCFHPGSAGKSEVEGAVPRRWRRWRVRRGSWWRTRRGRAEP
jgi:endonuclease IV